mmetsp:Transcript_17573/g.27375  ORF Transcript_17573/g.27375 Transcript_17573/m.27375 type:complete len:318 (-) Transcript_17573:105-1058(-)
MLLLTQLGRIDDGLDLIGVDDTRHIRIGHASIGHTLRRISTINDIQSLNCRLGPDAEPTHVATGSELQQIETLHAANLHTWQIAESTLNAIILGVDDQWTTTHDVATVAHLTLTRANLLAVSRLADVVQTSNCLQNLLGGHGLADALYSIVEHEWYLGDIIDLVSTRHNEGWDCGSCNGRGHRITLLRGVDLAVPLPPSLGRGKHASSAAHVTECSLSTAGGSASADAGDTGYGATGSPGMRAHLLTCANGHGVSLAIVLGHVRVDELDQIGAQRGGHDGWEWDGGVRGSAGGEYGDKGAGGHFKVVGNGLTVGGIF